MPNNLPGVIDIKRQAQFSHLKPRWQ
jgi:hypothetical protein